MSRFLLKNKCGTHIEPGKEGKAPVQYKPGDIVQSDRDLIELFPNKFEIPPGEAGQSNTPIVPPPDIPLPTKSVSSEDTDEKVDSPSGSKLVIGYGKDVTASFATAAVVDLRVFEKSKQYTVVDPEDGEPLHNGKLRKKQVEDFLQKFVEDEDEGQ